MSYSVVTNVTLDKEAIQKKITQARIEQDMSFGDLSKKTGISKGQLYKIERRLADNVPLLQIMSVCKALHISLSDLVGMK